MTAGPELQRPLGGHAPGVVLAIDLGGTHLRIAVADRDGAILTRSAERIDAAAGPEAILGQVVSGGRRALAERNAPPVIAVTLATPGLVDADRGVILAAHNLRGWRDVPAADLLSRAFGVPAGVENDVNLAALGERWRGAGAGADDLVFLAIGTGIGAGIIAGGRLQRGHGFAAGEVNRLPSGVRDADGAELGLEEVASGPAIVRRAVAHGLSRDEAVLTTAAVFAAAHVGDPVATAVLAQANEALAHGVAALVAALDPAVVVVGGGVSVQGERLLEPLRVTVGRYLRRRTPIVQSALGVDAQLYGAIRVALTLTQEHSG